jgi:MEMO1 family protein
MYTRPDSYAGGFYPADPAELSRMIDSFFNSAPNPHDPVSTIAIITPHAGYIYSGAVAGAAYAAIDPGTELAIVLAPTHRGHIPGASVIPEGEFRTPLGVIPIDGALPARLLDSPRFSFNRELEEAEHSNEVQMPFLRRRLTNFSLVSVLIGTGRMDELAAIADDIYTAIATDPRRKCVVISTDLSHFHPYNEAKKMDLAFIETLRQFDETALYTSLAGGETEACGFAPVIAGMMLARKLGADALDILDYRNSGDTAGDRARVVGYLAARFRRSAV